MRRGLRFHGPRVMLALTLAVLGSSIAQACLWDWDTLQMERRRFPGTLELITGKFVRHSPAYYQWRIEDRTKRLKSPAENPDLIDDIAVALGKLGRYHEGIALLDQSLEAHPDRYETLANLGTLQMLAGDLARGKELIDRAIVVNPDAHFGREKYQSLLAEYWLTERQTPHIAGTPDFSLQGSERPYGFAAFVLKKRWPDRSSRSQDEAMAELAAAQKGVLGMMHFANYDSPLLLEALGDLLIAPGASAVDAMHLAARAYFRVAQLSDNEEVQLQFRQAARNMVVGNLEYTRWRAKMLQGKPESSPEPDDLDKLAPDLDAEMVSARDYFTKIEADEKRWIAQGVSLDEAFAAKYYDSLDGVIEEATKQLAREPLDIRLSPDERLQRALLILAGLACGGPVVLIVGGYWALRIWRRSSAKAASA